MLDAMDDWRHDRIRAAHCGENPTVLARLPGGFATIGDSQWLPGYCVFLTDDPEVTRLSDLSRPRRLEYLESMADFAGAVERACRELDRAFRRVNIEILGNTDPYLHAHIHPRYDWESPDLVRGPVWWYPDEPWDDPAHALGPQHHPIREAITRQLAAH